MAERILLWGGPVGRPLIKGLQREGAARVDAASAQRPFSGLSCCSAKPSQRCRAGRRRLGAGRGGALMATERARRRSLQAGVACLGWLCGRVGSTKRRILPGDRSRLASLCHASARSTRESAPDSFRRHLFTKPTSEGLRGRFRGRRRCCEPDLPAEYHARAT